MSKISSLIQSLRNIHFDFSFTRKNWYMVGLFSLLATGASIAAYYFLGNQEFIILAVIPILALVLVVVKLLKKTKKVQAHPAQTAIRSDDIPLSPSLPQAPTITVWSELKQLIMKQQPNNTGPYQAELRAAKKLLCWLVDASQQDSMPMRVKLPKRLYLPNLETTADKLIILVKAILTNNDHEVLKACDLAEMYTFRLNGRRPDCYEIFFGPKDCQEWKTIVIDNNSDSLVFKQPENMNV